MGTLGGLPEFWIDVGGTFTDCIAVTGDGQPRAHKLLSTGVYKGTVEAGSTRDLIGDARRNNDPAGFFAGWEIEIACNPPLRARIESSDAGQLWLSTLLDQ